MTMKINNILKVSLIGLTCFVLSACGGNKKPAEEAAVANGSDITRPPSIVKDRLPSETVKNPDETISFDEWKKKRDAELNNKVEPTP
jgi:hypothetical protein